MTDPRQLLLSINMNTAKQIRVHIRDEIRVDARERIIAALDSSQAAVYRTMIARDDSVRAARAERRRQ